MVSFCECVCISECLGILHICSAKDSKVILWERNSFEGNFSSETKKAKWN